MKGKNWFSHLPFFQRRKSYEPWYEDYSDYNTNAKSYYDYLARFNKLIRTIVEFINRLMNRNIEVKDTESIKFIKEGDWLDNGNCEPNHYNDIIKLSSHVKISNETEKFNDKIINNGSKIKNDGVWSPDYKNVLSEILQEIKNINNNQNKIENVLQKIIDNLYESGAITNNNIYEFEFKEGRNIATGNINLFGGNPDGNTFIRTNKGKTENDITAGVD